MFCKPSHLRSLCSILLPVSALCSLFAFDLPAREIADKRLPNIEKFVELAIAKKKDFRTFSNEFFTPDELIEQVKSASPTAYFNGKKYRLKISQAGHPKIQLPFAVAPGTNGMTPQLSINLTPEKGAPVSIDGLDTIRQCGTGNLCLNGVRLARGLTATNNHILYPINDPLRKIIEIDDGFLMTDGSGHQSLFQKGTSPLKDETVWRVALQRDRFGNFVAFQYNNDTGRLNKLHYGHKDATAPHLRSVHFQFESKDTPYAVMTSFVGRKQVRTYLVEMGRHAHASRVTECGYGDASDRDNKLICAAPLSLEWKSMNNEDGQFHLMSIHDGIGGKTQFEYHEVEGRVALKSFTELDQDKKLREVSYAYNGLQTSQQTGDVFKQVFQHETGTDTVSVTTYGTGDLIGKIRSKAVYQGKLDQMGKIIQGQQLSRRTYSYEKVPGALVPSYVLSEIREEGAAGQGASPSITARRHDVKGRLISTSNKRGSVTYRYLDDQAPVNAPDYLSNLIVEERDTDKKTDQELVKNWSYKFTNGQIANTTYQESLDGKLISDRTRKQWFDTYGNAIKISNAAGIAEFQFDSKLATFPVRLTISQDGQRDIALFRHDPKSGQVLHQQLRGDATTDYTIDAFGRVNKTVSFFETTGEKGRRLHTTEEVRWHLTDAKRVEEVTSVTVTTDNAPAETITVTKVFDPFGNLLSEEKPEMDATRNPIKTKIQYHYGIETLEMITDHPERGREHHVFDKSGRLISQQKEGYERLSYAYDALGRLQEIQRGNAQVQFKYDQRNRLISKILSDNKRYEFGYDGEDSTQIKSVKLPSGLKLNYAYDGQGRATAKTVLVPLSKGGYYNFETRFKYANDRLDSVHYPDGSILGYTYQQGALDRIKWRQTRAGNKEQAGEVVARFEHKLAASGGYIREKKLANNLVDRTTWNRRGMLSSIELLQRPQNASTATEGLLARLGYAIDPVNGRVKVETRAQSNANNQIMKRNQYHYNTAGNLITVDQEQSAHRPTGLIRNGTDIALKYDASGNISQRNVGGEQYEFGFDAENNLIQSLHWKKGKEVATHYEYDHTGARIKKATENGDVTYYINPFYEFTVRKDGKLQETRYVWDQRGRIAAYTNEVVDHDLAAIQLLNGEGDPKIQGKVAAYLKSLPLAEIAKNISLASLFFIGGLLVLLGVLNGVRGGVTVVVLSSFMTLAIAPTAQAVTTATHNANTFIDQVRFFHMDMRGSVYAVTGADGRVLESHSYTPYGQAVKYDGRQEKLASQPRFAGHEFDPESGLYYMGARYYDPVAGRFLSPDPARSTANPYEYANGNPISFIDPDGRSGEEAPLSRWQRFKKWTGINNWRCCGAENRQVIPDEWGGPPTEAEKAEFDEYHRTKSVEGWTRFGGYLQSLMIVPILAYAFPTSKVVDGEDIVPGYGVDLLTNAIKVTIFSAFGKAYTAVEALSWDEVMERGATPRDGQIMLAKRMAYKVGVQVPLFTGAAYFQRYLSGFPLQEHEDLLDDMGFLLAQYTLMSIFGNLFLLPYYYGSKPWSATGDTDPDFRQLVADSTGFLGFLKKAGLAYRDFSSRREFWATELGGFFRSQYGWFFLYVLQMYALYHLGSVGYYTGYALFGLIASSTNWGFDWSQFDYKWVKNIVSLQLSPASSPVALINSRSRRSITLMREVSPLSPETGWFLTRTLGGVGGLRLAKYMDSSYASDHRIVEWLINNDRRQLPAPPSEDTRVIEIEEEDEIEMQSPNVPMGETDEEEIPTPREIERES